MSKVNFATNYQPDPTELAKVQEKADAALRLFNESAPRSLEGETVAQYERRMAMKVQRHAPNFQNVRLHEAMGSAFDVLEKQIYDDARKEAARPTMIPEGELREVIKKDQSGRPFSVFYGSPSAWMSQFTDGRKRIIANISTETKKDGDHLTNWIYLNDV